MPDEYIPGQFADLIRQGSVSGSGTPFIGGTSSTSSSLGFLVLEGGGFIILEDGNKIQTE